MSTGHSSLLICDDDIDGCGANDKQLLEALVHSIDSCSLLLLLLLAECAIGISEKGTGATPKKTTTKRVRRKAPVRGKADAADGGSSSDSSSVDERDADDPNAGEWVCQVCSGDRSERERYSFNRWKKRK